LTGNARQNTPTSSLNCVTSINSVDYRLFLSFYFNVEWKEAKMTGPMDSYQILI
jgi:hypothetical protein